MSNAVKPFPILLFGLKLKTPEIYLNFPCPC